MSETKLTTRVTDVTYMSGKWTIDVSRVEEVTEGIDAADIPPDVKDAITDFIIGKPGGYLKLFGQVAARAGFENAAEVSNYGLAPLSKDSTAAETTTKEVDDNSEEKDPAPIDSYDHRL